MEIKTDIRNQLSRIVTFYIGDIGVEIELSLVDDVFSISKEDIIVFVANDEEIEILDNLIDLEELIYATLRPYINKKLEISDLGILIDKIKKVIVEYFKK